MEVTSIKANFSSIFDWDICTKKELKHILIMLEQLGKKEDIFKVIKEIQFGKDICKHCKTMHKKELIK
jgi:hypothetical protein